MTTKDFVASYFEAWNHHDAGSVADHLSQGGKYYDVPEQQRLSRDALIEHLKEFFARDRNRYSLVGEILTGENSIAFQYLASPIDPEDKSESWIGAEFITMEGDIAGKIEDYYPHPEKGLEQSPVVRSVRTQRYAKSGLDEAGIQRVMDRLRFLMDDQRVFLDSNLSLPQLASELNCSVNHLSQAINAGFGMSFFDNINQYRVTAAKDLLSREGENCRAILDVALSFGFNSTSTFYAAFKKSTGQTPAQFRRSSRDN